MAYKTKMTYAGTGVDYDAMDPFKRMAQIAGRDTSKVLQRFGFQEVEESRGESAYIIDTSFGVYLAHVEEGLGTKDIVADAMYALTGKTYYDHIAQCTLAMIYNDMITVGALPFSNEMHIAVGDSNWFKDEKRTQDLVLGWKNACIMAGCAWGGGETPTLRGVVLPDRVVLSGSAFGLINPKRRLMLGSHIQDGDSIIIFVSSGIHANGLTMAREIAKKLPEGYLTKLPDGKTYGESLLEPTIIYVRLIEECFKKGYAIHYGVNITGHGWRKLMRARQPFTYIINKVPIPHPIFFFMQENGPIDDEEAYGNLNMGAGFALFVKPCDANRVMRTADILGYKSMLAGYVERAKEHSQVIIQPKNLVYKQENLGIR